MQERRERDARVVVRREYEGRGEGEEQNAIEKRREEKRREEKWREGGNTGDGYGWWWEGCAKRFCHR